MSTDPGYDPSQALSGARQVANLAWAWLAVGGVVTVSLGLVSILLPGVTVSLLAVLFSSWLLLAGGTRVALAVAASGWPTWRRWLVGPLGVVMVLAGVAGLVNVAGSERLLAAVIGVGFLIAAGVDLTLGATAAGGRSRVTSFGLAALHLFLAGVFLLLPQVGLTVIALLIGVGFLLLGAALIAAALVVRRTTSRLIAEAEAAAGRRGPEEGGPRVIEGEVL